tara:strand:+ start:88 stop:438 length:351 start_codon:yes stop_codon:yes gene_type:complete
MENKMKNLMNKTRTAENPYATFEKGSFVSHVIRAYTTKQEEFSRWYTVAKSDMSFGQYEIGDTYIKEITDNLELVYASPEFIKQYPELSFKFQMKDKLKKQGINEEWMSNHLEIIT